MCKITVIAKVICSISITDKGVYLTKHVTLCTHVTYKKLRFSLGGGAVAFYGAEALQCWKEAGGERNPLQSQLHLHYMNISSVRADEADEI